MTASSREDSCCRVATQLETARLAVDLEVPLITDLQFARAVVNAIFACPKERLEVLP